MRTLRFLFLALLLTGCASSSGVVSIGSDTYAIVKAGRSGFTSAGALKGDAYKEAEEFARSKGKQLEVVAVNEIPAGFARLPQVEVRFRLVDKKP